MTVTGKGKLLKKMMKRLHHVAPLVLCCFCALAAHVRGDPKRPHILMILSDDFGWGDAGWHRPGNYAEVSTPAMTALVKEGIELDRHYAFKYCSPSRCALQSGRHPIHVNVMNTDPGRTHSIYYTHAQRER